MTLYHSLFVASVTVTDTPSSITSITPYDVPGPFLRLMSVVVLAVTVPSPGAGVGSDSGFTELMSPEVILRYSVKR